MLSSFILSLIFAATLPIASKASVPTVFRQRDLDGGLVSRRPQLEALQLLQERDTITLGTFNLSYTAPPSDVLISIPASTAINSASDADIGDAITLICTSCYTLGTAIVSTTGVTTNDSLLDNVDKFFQDPAAVVVDALNLELDVQLQGLAGHFELDLQFDTSGTFTVPLLPPGSPFGVKLPGTSNEIGVFFEIELIISVSTAVDFSFGFDVAFPHDIGFILNPLSGDLVSMNVTGAQIHTTPVQFGSGSACIDAILRFKVSAGVGLSVLGTGVNFEAGVYWDPINYEACVTFQPSEACQLLFTETFHEEIGAYAEAIAKIDYVSWGASPSAVTTYVSATLPSACLVTGSSGVPLNNTAPHITTTMIASKSSSVEYSTTQSHSTATTFAHSTSPSNSAPILIETGSKTVTVYKTSTYTIIGCSSAYEICPTSLTTNIVITKTATLYTTTCPASQTVFPTSISALPITRVSVYPSMSLVSLTPCETPIVSTIGQGTSKTSVVEGTLTLSSSATPLKTAVTITMQSSLISAVAGTNLTSSYITSTRYISSSSRVSTSFATSSAILGDAIASMGGFTSASTPVASVGIVPSGQGNGTSTGNVSSTGSLLPLVTSSEASWTRAYLGPVAIGVLFAIGTHF